MDILLNHHCLVSVFISFILGAGFSWLLFGKFSAKQNKHFLETETLLEKILSEKLNYYSIIISNHLEVSSQFTAVDYQNFKNKFLKEVLESFSKNYLNLLHLIYSEEGLQRKILEVFDSRFFKFYLENGQPGDMV